jgi:hypothetical protein
MDEDWTNDDAPLLAILLFPLPGSSFPGAFFPLMSPSIDKTTV